jgi:NADPH-dependent 2,4-dienoyl-CoA reductase/sulfur reductase-like enzyme
MITKEVDLAIIGAGPAGMAAAISAKESMLKNILILERAENPGGLLHQCIHNGFGLHYFKQDLTGPEYGERFIQKIKELEIPLCLNTMVTHLYPDKSFMAINQEWGEFEVLSKSIVLAMGCREKTRHAIGIPGSRPAGIYTAGLAQKFVNVDGYLPGKEFVILGSGDIGMIMARRLCLEGATVKAVVEIMPYVGGLIRNEVQCLHDFNIPLLLEHTVTEIYGNDRVEGVKVAQVGQGKILTDSERRIECDCLLLSVGLIPENELSEEAGIQLDENTNGPMVDEFLQTDVDGIFAAGNVLQVYDLVDNVTMDGEKAGKNAAKYVAGALKREAKEIRVVIGENIRSATPQRIIGLEGIELALRVKKPLENAELTIGHCHKKYRVLSPTEVIKVTLSPSDLKTGWERGDIEVVCYGKQKRKNDD